MFDVGGGGGGGSGGDGDGSVCVDDDVAAEQT